MEINGTMEISLWSVLKSVAFHYGFLFTIRVHTGILY